MKNCSSCQGTGIEIIDEDYENTCYSCVGEGFVIDTESKFVSLTEIAASFVSKRQFELTKVNSYKEKDMPKYFKVDEYTYMYADACEEKEHSEFLMAYIETPMNKIEKEEDIPVMTMQVWGWED